MAFSDFMAFFNSFLTFASSSEFPFLNNPLFLLIMALMFFGDPWFVIGKHFDRFGWYCDFLTKIYIVTDCVR